MIEVTTTYAIHHFLFYTTGRRHPKAAHKSYMRIIDTLVTFAGAGKSSTPNFCLTFFSLKNKEWPTVTYNCERDMQE